MDRERGQYTNIHTYTMVLEKGLRGRDYRKVSKRVVCLCIFVYSEKDLKRRTRF